MIAPPEPKHHQQQPQQAQEHHQGPGPGAGGQETPQPPPTQHYMPVHSQAGPILNANMGGYGRQMRLVSPS